MVLAAPGQGMRKNCASALPDIPTLSLILRRKEICVRPELSLLKAIMTVVCFCVVAVTVQKKSSPEAFYPVPLQGAQPLKTKK